MLSDLERVVEKFGREDIFLELRGYEKRQTTITIRTKGKLDIEESKIKGVYLRAFQGDFWITAVLDAPSLDTLEKTVQTVMKNAKMHLSENKNYFMESYTPYTDHYEMPVREKFSDYDVMSKFDTVRDIHQQLNDFDLPSHAKLKNSSVQYFDLTEHRYIVNSLGTSLDLTSYRISLMFQLVVQSSSLIPSATRLGRTQGYEVVTKHLWEDTLKNVQARAVRLSNAKFLPREERTVILDPELIRLLGHESFGHPNEADIVLGGSYLTNKIGEQIAPEWVTILDDGTNPHDFGTLPKYDDEGTPASKTVMVENGILKTHLHSRETAFRMNTTSTGNARAYSHRFDPIVRMTNTIFLGGDSSLEEIINETKQGILLHGRRMGQADTTGEFMFGVGEAIEIKNGELGQTYREVTIAGNALEVLNSIDLMSKDIKTGYAGFCGKGQIAFTGGGGPYVRTKMLVGGKT